MTTGIAWATDTVSPLKGCSKCSSECANCYALNWANRHQAKGTPGYEGTVANMRFTGKIGFVEAELERLASIKSARVFVDSVSDTFHENVPDEQVRRIFEAMADNPHPETQFLVCTKRSGRMAEFSRTFSIPKRIWCGVTVGVSSSLFRLDDLRNTKADIRWCSFEPLLGEVAAEPWMDDGTLSWVVVGGESGNRFRPMEPAWAERIVRAAHDRGIPAFVKQHAARHPKLDAEYPPVIAGRVWHEYPA